DLGLRFLEPGLVLGEPLLQVAHAGGILVELVAVVGAEAGSQLLRLVADVVENAPAVRQAPGLGPDFFGRVGEEEPREDLGGRRRGRHWGSGPRPGDALAFARQRQAGNAGLSPEMLRRELVQRDLVAEAGPSRPLGPGQGAGRPGFR